MESFFPNLEAARGAMILLFMSTGGSLAGCRDNTLLDEINAASDFAVLQQLFNDNFGYEISPSDSPPNAYFPYDNVLIFQKKHGPQKAICFWNP